MIVLLFFTYLLNFTLTYVDFFSFMVENFLSKVEFLSAVFLCLILLPWSIRPLMTVWAKPNYA